MSANGRPLIEISAFGIAFVIGDRRVPKPPARMTQGSTSAPCDHGGPVEVELEPHLLQPLCDESLPQHGWTVSVEEEKPTRSGANKLPAQRAVLHRHVVPTVDLIGGHARGPLLLV